MIPFSNLLRFRLVDDQQKTYRVEDFAIQLPAESYAPVIDILWRAQGQKLMRLPWSAVKNWDERSRKIKTGSLEKSQLAEAEWLERAVLLKRDILDAILLDLRGRSTVLANDLLLEKKGSELLLKAVDIGLLAILRRFTGGLFQAVQQSALRDWNYVEFLRGDPQAAVDGLDYHGLIARMPPGEIAYLADQLPYPYATELLALLPEPTAADTLEKMIPTLQLQVFEELDPKKAQRILALMRPDIIADLLSRLDTAKAQECLERLPRALNERVLQLLMYPEDTAGGIMTNNMITLPGSTTVTKALALLAKSLKSPEYQDIIPFIYVVDSPAGQKLQGALRLSDLLTANGETRLDKLMNPYLISLSPFQPAHKAARRVIESGIPALPVIARDGRILGVVTVDSALDISMPKIGGREVFRLFS